MFNRWPLSKRLTTINLIYLGPILLLAALLALKTVADIRFTMKERDGVSYLRTVVPSWVAVLQSRPADMAKLQDVGARYDSEMESWIAAEKYQSSLEMPVSAEERSAAAVTLIRNIGEESNLILDSELTSYYLMESAITRIPDLLNTTTRIIGLADRLASYPDDAEARHAFANEDGILHMAIVAHDDTIAESFRRSRGGSVGRSLRAAHTRTLMQLRTLEALCETLTNQIVSAEEMRATAADMARLRGPLIADMARLHDSVLVELDKQLVDRLRNLWTVLALSLAGSAISVIIAVLFTIRLTRRMTDAVSVLAHQMSEVAENRSHGDIPFQDDASEFGKIARTLWRLREQSLERSALTAQMEARREESRLQLERVAYWDELTGLQNRKGFEQRLASMIETEAHTKNGALIFIDLDHFREFNDLQGHLLGNRLIQEVSKRLSHMSRGDDLIARTSGDGFGFLLWNIDDQEFLTQFCDRLRKRLAEPYEVDGNEHYLTVSLGACQILQNRDHDIIELMRRATVALHHAKIHGRDRIVIFDSALDTEMLYRKTIENALREAIAADEIELAYQPQVCARTGAIVGVEALARWDSRKHGKIPPGLFISIAEGSGLINALGRNLLRKLFLQSKAWSSLTLGINVSVVQLRQRGFVDTLAELAVDTGVDPGQIELELTESMLLENWEEASAGLVRMREMGFRLALDDFGTGYSSLSYLNRHRFDKLKIDRSFVEAVGNTTDGASIVFSIVSLGNALGMTITAEGVETEAQRDFLRAAGSTYLQGYFYSPPVSAAEITTMLARSSATSVEPRVA